MTRHRVSLHGRFVRRVIFSPAADRDPQRSRIGVVNHEDVEQAGDDREPGAHLVTGAVTCVPGRNFIGGFVKYTAMRRRHKSIPQRFVVRTSPTALVGVFIHVLRLNQRWQRGRAHASLQKIVPAFIARLPRGIHHVIAAERETDDPSHHDAAKVNRAFGTPSLVKMSRTWNKPREQRRQRTIP